MEYFNNFNYTNLYRVLYNGTLQNRIREFIDYINYERTTNRIYILKNSNKSFNFNFLIRARIKYNKYIVDNDIYKTQIIENALSIGEKREYQYILDILKHMKYISKKYPKYEMQNLIVNGDLECDTTSSYLNIEDNYSNKHIDHYMFQMVVTYDYIYIRYYDYLDM